jgi:hypothetical protein
MKLHCFCITPDASFSKSNPTASVIRPVQMCKNSVRGEHSDSHCASTLRRLHCILTPLCAFFAQLACSQESLVQVFLSCSSEFKFGSLCEGNIEEDIYPWWRSKHANKLCYRITTSIGHIVAAVKCRRQRWIGHVAKFEIRNWCKILIGLPRGIRPLGRPRSWKNELRIAYLVQWQSFVLTALNVPV